MTPDIEVEVEKKEDDAGWRRAARSFILGEPDGEWRRRRFQREVYVLKGKWSNGRGRSPNYAAGGRICQE